MSTDGSTLGSEDEWETASGESTDDDEVPLDILCMDLPLASDGGQTTGDEGAENVDREAIQEARNRINEIISNTNPGKFFKHYFYIFFSSC